MQRFCWRLRLLKHGCWSNIFAETCGCWWIFKHCCWSNIFCIMLRLPIEFSTKAADATILLKHCWCWSVSALSLLIRFSSVAVLIYENFHLKTIFRTTCLYFISFTKIPTSTIWLVLPFSILFSLLIIKITTKPYYYYYYYYL